jgi:hypothetical protein
MNDTQDMFKKCNLRNRNAAGVFALLGLALGAMILGLRLVVTKSDAGFVPGAVLALAFGAAAWGTGFWGASFFISRKLWWMAGAAWAGTWIWGMGPAGHEHWTEVQRLASFWAFVSSGAASLLLATRPMIATLGVRRDADLACLSWATLWQQFLDRRELNAEPEWMRVAALSCRLYPEECQHAAIQWTWFKDAVEKLPELPRAAQSAPRGPRVAGLGVVFGAVLAWLVAVLAPPTATWFTRAETPDEIARRTMSPEGYWDWRVEHGNGATYFEVPHEFLTPRVISTMTRHYNSAVKGAAPNAADPVVQRFVDLRLRWFGLTADGKTPTGSPESDEARRSRLEKVVRDWFGLPPREQLLFWVGFAATEAAWGVQGEQLRPVSAILLQELCGAAARFSSAASSDGDAAFWLRALPHANWYHLLQFMKIGTCPGIPPEQPVVKW